MTRRYHADPTAPLRGIWGNVPFSEADQTELSLPVHLCLEALRTGRATEVDFDTLALIANVCLIRAEMIDKAARKRGRLHDPEAQLMVPVIQRAQDALLTLKARAMHTGRFVATGPELQEITTVVDIHDQLLALSTPRQMKQALREIMRRVQRGQVARIEEAAT